MNRRFSYSIVVVLLMAGIVDAGTIPDSLQATHRDQESSPPFWVSESMVQASVGDGSLIATQHFQHFDHTRWLFDQFPLVSKSQAERDVLVDCKPFVYTMFHHSTETAADLRERAHYIASVSLVDSKPGFSHGRPGELLEVEVSDVLKNEGEVAFNQGFYLFHSYARMIVDGRAICIGKPLPSGEFLVFLADKAPWTELPVYDLDSSALISISAEPSIHGNLFQPRNAAKELPVLLDGIGR